MDQIAATVIDAVDIRAYECLLPGSVELSRLALRLAELMHLPLVGPDGRALAYGLIPKGGSLIDPESTLAESNLPCPLTLRIVPDIAAGKDDLVPAEDELEYGDEKSDMDIVVGEPTAMVHDADLGSRPDVRIDAEVHKRIEVFAAANRNRECAGLLLGTVDSEDKGRIIHISAAIPAEDAIGTRTSVRIPLEAWEAVLRARDLDYGHLRILGWFHTHAGWGVFMSDSDVFIHRHFFPHPSMVAYVLDPTTGRDGFFYWHEGKIGLCPSYGLVGAASDVAAHKPRAKVSTPLLSRIPFDPRNGIIAVLAVAVVYLAFAGSPFSRHSAGKVATPGAPPKQAVVTRELSPPAIRTYSIGFRDNPWTIANRIYHDGDLGAALMHYNGLPGNPRLQIGQKIKLPAKATLKG